MCGIGNAGETLMPLLPKDQSKRHEHEEYSIVAIKEIFRPIIEDHPVCVNFSIKAEEVAALLGDSTLLVNSTVKTKRVLFLWRQLISGQLDADRADYLLRDSLHLGVAYGLYDRSRLVACMALGKIKNAETNANELTLAVENKAWHVAESLVLARYQMFSQVYWHKVRRIYDYHITQAIKDILGEECQEKGEQGCYPPPERIEDYLSFDDWTVYAALKNGQGGKHGQIILSRLHYKCIYETELIPTEKDAAEMERFKSEYKSAGKAFYIDDITRAYWYKTEKDINIILDNGQLAPLSDKSPLLKALVASPRQKRFYASI
jgi:HD superfamily phosphohydrolase